MLRRLLVSASFVGVMLLGLFAVALPAQAASPFGNFGESSVSTCAYDNLGWVICPVLRATSQAGDNAFTFITQDFMAIETGLFNAGSGAAQAGATVRIIANVLFAIVLLVIVYSLITGQGVSNYNIKRMAPRFIVAVMLVQFSFFVCQIFVDITNILGVGVQQILVDQITHGIGPSAIPVGTTPGASTTETLATLTSAVISNSDIAWPLLAPLSAVVILTALICSVLIIILIVRKALVVALMLLAPLAFVAYLLPNTSDYFSRWLRMFTGTLVLFPVVAVLIGTGQVVSASIIKAGGSGYSVKNDTVAVTNKSSGSATLYLVASAAAVMPLVGTLWAFKFAMSAFDAAGARVSQRGLHKSSREREEDVKKREQTAMDMNKKSMMMRGINRLQQLSVVKGGESTTSIFSRGGAYRGRGKHQVKSAEQAKFDGQVQQRLSELRGGDATSSPQELYSQALQRYQDKLGDAGDNGLNINSYEGIELKASEAYLLESLAAGMNKNVSASTPGAQQNDTATSSSQSGNQAEDRPAGLSSLDRGGKSSGATGGGDSQQSDSYRPPATAGGVPAAIGQGVAVVVQQGAAAGGAESTLDVGQLAGGTGFAQRRPAQTDNELLAKARAARYVAEAQDAPNSDDELLGLAARDTPTPPDNSNTQGM